MEQMTITVKIQIVVDETDKAVSYTHLDVYKRQIYTGSGAGFDDGSVLGYAGDVRGDGACNFERYGKKCRSLQGSCCR